MTRKLGRDCPPAGLAIVEDGWLTGWTQTELPIRVYNIMNAKGNPKSLNL